MKLMTKLIAGAVLIGGIATVAVVATRADAPKPDEPTPAAVAAGARAEGAGDSEPSAAGARRDRAPRKLPSAEARDRLERDIAAARKRRNERERIEAARRAGDKPAQRVSRRPDFDKDYIRSRMQDLLPLVRECYDMALETDPTLGGKIVVDFNIVGEPDVGGLVELSEIDEAESTLKHAGMNECVRETVYGLDIEPPPGGGSVRVRYPITFSTLDE